MDALLALHQLLNWYWRSANHYYKRPRPVCFLSEVYRSFFIPPFFPSFPTTQNITSCNDRRREQAAFLNTHTLALLPPFFLPIPQQSDSFEMLRAREFSWCCVVWVCGLQLNREAANRVDERERETNTVYFNLFRMPELRPEFLLSRVPQLAVSIPPSCSLGCHGRSTPLPRGSPSICLGSGLLIPRDSNVNGIAEGCDYFAFVLARYIAMKVYLAGLRKAGPLRY